MPERGKSGHDFGERGERKHFPRIALKENPPCPRIQNSRRFCLKRYFCKRVRASAAADRRYLHFRFRQHSAFGKEEQKTYQYESAPKEIFRSLHFRKEFFYPRAIHARIICHLRTFFQHSNERKHPCGSPALPERALSSHGHRWQILTAVGICHLLKGAVDSS